MLKLRQKVSKNYTVSEVINTPERIKEIFANNNPNEKVGIVTKSGKLRLLGEAFLFNKICGKDPVKAEEVRNKWIQTFIDRGCFMAVKGDVVGVVKPVEEAYVDELKGKLFKCIKGRSLFFGAFSFTLNKFYMIELSTKDSVTIKADGGNYLSLLKEDFSQCFEFTENNEEPKPIVSDVTELVNEILEEDVDVTPTVNPFNNETEYLFAQKNPDYDPKKENVYDRKISIEAWALALNLIMVVIGVISFYFMAQLPLWFWVMLISVDIIMNVVLIVLHRKIK
jgi:hypothetical protein